MRRPRSQSHSSCIWRARSWKHCGQRSSAAPDGATTAMGWTKFGPICPACSWSPWPTTTRWAWPPTAKKLKVDKAFADYRQMLDEVKPDVVSIAPRWLDQHRDMVVATAERGIHIYLEKPLCRTLAEADEMVATCERTHAKLAIAHTTRHSPRIPVVKEMLAANKIGRVLELRGRGKEDPARRRRGSVGAGHAHHGSDSPVRRRPELVLRPGHRRRPADHQGRRRRRQRGHRPSGRRRRQRDVRHAERHDGLFRLAPRHIAASGPASRLQIFGSEGILEITTGYLPSVKYLADPSWSPGQSGAKWETVTSAGLGKPEPLTDGKDHSGNRAGRARAARRDSRKPPAQGQHLRRPGRHRDDRRGLRVAPARQAGRAAAEKSAKPADDAVGESSRRDHGLCAAARNCRLRGLRRCLATRGNRSCAIRGCSGRRRVPRGPGPETPGWRWRFGRRSAAGAPSLSPVLRYMTSCGIEPPFISLPASSLCWSVFT